MASVVFNLYRLNFPAGLHINTGNDHNEKGEDVIHSDTLVAALMSSLAKMGKEVKGDEFVLSSLFPWVKKSGKYIYFMPVPFLPPPAKDQDAKESKRWKKVRWMELAIWERVVQGAEHLDAKPNGKFLSQDSSIQNPMHKGLRLRSRVGIEWEEDTKPYYIDELHFERDSGLYFIFDSTDSRNTLIHEALEVLSSEGLGTDRSVGKGYFTYELDTIEISYPQNSNYAMSMGMFLPESQGQLLTMLDEHASYQLKRRGGWISTANFVGKKKNSIYMFTAGSVFNTGSVSAPKTMGKVADISPSEPIGLDHAIYRSGRSLFIPIKMT